jgi:hypothetical protein
MTRSSIKSLWQNSGWSFALLAFVARPVLGADELSHDYKLRFDARFGYHLLEPRDLATHRYQVETEQKFKYGNWTAVAGLRAYAEGAYAANAARYAAPVREQESSEVVLRDLYLQYQSDPLLLRVGNQQVVWGETFGFYYADIVNPKDLRELTLGDLEAERIPVPMVNAKLIFSTLSFQGIYIPRPFFDKVAAVGSDFSPYAGFFPGAQLSVVDNRVAPWNTDNGEFGLRATALVSGIDLSLFYLNYLDRLPHYSASVLGFAPLSVELQGAHPRMQTIGWTGTADLSWLLLRWETLLTKDRTYDRLNGMSYSNAKTDELTAVLGIDYTQLEKWRLGLQLSETYLAQDIVGNLTPRSRQLISVHANGSLWNDQTLDLIFSYEPDDGGTLTQLRYMIPLNNQLELGVGADLLRGSPTSQFGRFRQGSRAFALLKAYFGKS